MAQITTGGNGNWSSTTNNAPWPGGTKPSAGDTVVIAASHTITLDENTPALGGDGSSTWSIDSTSGVLAVSGTRTINGCVRYQGTATSGFVTVGTDAALTIDFGGGSGTTALVNTSTGYAILLSGNGVLTISNSGGGALTSATGRAVQSTTTGTITITGSMACTNYGIGLFHSTGAGTLTVNGNAIASATGNVIHWNAGTFNFNGMPFSTSASNGAAGAVSVNGGTCNWTGTYTLASTEMAQIQTTGSSTLNCGTNGTALAITNNGGQLLINRRAGTVVTTYMTITDTAAASQSMLLGQGFTVTKQNLTAGNVKDGVTILGVTGTYAGHTPAEIAAAMWDDDTSPDRTVTA